MTGSPAQGTLQANGLVFSVLQAGSDGELVICLHGFPDTPHTFRHQLSALAAAGYQTIAPYLRGYEPQSQPADGDYNLVTLASDVIGWLDDLGVERAHVVGHDWGAVIGYVTAARHPDRVHSLSALAIPPLSRIPEAVRRVPWQLQRSWYMTWFQLRGLAERSVSVGDMRLIRYLWGAWSPGYEIDNAEWEALKEAFGQPGVVSAALAYYRQNATPPIMLGLRNPPAMAETEISVPTLIVNGADDGCMDRRLFQHTIRVDDFPAGVEYVELADAGHFLHLEQPMRINQLLLQHIS